MAAGFQAGASPKGKVKVHGIVMVLPWKPGGVYFIVTKFCPDSGERDIDLII